MAHQENLFPEFPPVSKKEWLERILKDLKGRPYGELSWTLNSEISLPPVFCREDREQPVVLGGTGNQWEIGEVIDVNSFSEGNNLALEALVKGAGALRFVWNESFSLTDLRQLLEGIKAPFISLHFVLTENTPPVPFLNQLEEFLGEDVSVARGSVTQSQGLPANKRILNTLKETQGRLPDFRLINVEIEDRDDPLQSLKKAIRQAEALLADLTEQGLPAGYIASRIQFSINCGKRYFVEMAKIRALRILWTNVLEAYGVADINVRLVANTSETAYTEDSYTNMIIATTIAMSAVIGGVDGLFITPANANTEPPSSFTRRIARNLQHIMQMEGYLDQVADPAAGSYYIDTLTKKLVEKSWDQFCQ